MKEILIVQINFLTSKSKAMIENDCGLVSIHRVSSNNYSKDVKIVRDSFCEYFNSNEGQVQWQRKMVSVRRSVKL